MNYRFCVKCGAKLLYVDAPCDRCLASDVFNQSDLTTEKLSPKKQSKNLKVKIEIYIREVAMMVNVDTGYKLQKETGFTQALAFRLWKGDWRTLDISTLTVLCNTFQCTPNDILKLVEEKENA